MQTTSPDLTAIGALSDSLGVLSIYVDADPEGMAGSKSTWTIEIENRLGELREAVKDTETHDRWTAIHAALDRLEPRIAALAEPGAPGRGRALFAPLSDGSAEEVVIQLPLETAVALDERPRLTPLAAALDEGRPTGLLTVARDGLRVVDLRLGVAEEAERMEFDERRAATTEIVGTPGHNPALGAPSGGGVDGGGPATGSMYQQSGSPQRDRFERKMEDHQVRFMADAAQDVLRMARERGWERVAIAGDPRLTRGLAEALGRPDAGLELVCVDGIFEWQRPAQLAQALAPALAEAQRERELSLVREALDRAAAGGQGAAGPADVGAALTEGRVHLLLLESGRELAGVSAPDGRLAPLGVVPEGVAPEELAPVPHLEERLAALALDTSARVVMVEGEAGELLADGAGGVAAILRW
jgi:hypothetical protein